MDGIYAEAEILPQWDINRQCRLMLQESMYITIDLSGARYLSHTQSPPPPPSTP